MTIDLKPETERLIQEEIKSGHFHSLDDLIQEGVYAWREKHQMIDREPGKPLRNLADFLLNSPFSRSNLELERGQNLGRPVDL